jgi:broad specificity phosphatase PhoE
MVERANELFAWLHSRPESNIAVITHSAFLSVLFNKAVAAAPSLQKWFDNAELRTALLEL